MVNLFSRVSRFITDQDLFGIPVQLTFKGDSAFNTFCGGCVSIIFIVTFTVIFCLQLHTSWTHPKFQSYPPELDYNIDSVVIEPMTGSTWAIGINVTEAQSRLKSAESALQIQFQQTTPDPDGEPITFDGVYCKDLYADQIEAERNGTSSNQDFTKNFADYYN